MILSALLTLALLLVLAYGAYEVRRWYTPAGRDLVSPRQRRLRAWGLFLLLLTLGLWLGGTFLPRPGVSARPTALERQAALRFIGYWTVTVLAALPLIPLALLDARENLRRLRDERKKLFRETLAADNPDSADPSSSASASS